MIVVDTSALIAIVLKEPAATNCAGAISVEPFVLISAGTLAEAYIVAARRHVSAELAQLVDGLGLVVMTVSAASAQRMNQAYERWGRGMHPASLNFGDCFAYELAKEQGCRLLYIGNDFSQTDIESVLQS